MSTQPFGSSTERMVGRMIDQAETDEAATGVNKKQDLSEAKAESKSSSPADLDIDHLTDAFQGSSSISLPNARLVLAHPPWTGIKNDAIIPLSNTSAGWNMVGVVQRTQDVRMKFHLPYHDSRPDLPNPRSIPSIISCSIYYNPTDDDCILWNHSLFDIYLTSIGPEGHKKGLVSGANALISPGLWRLSVESKARHEIKVLDFLVLRRQFAVSIKEAVDSHSAKRKATDLYPIPTKRPRQDVDATEIILAPTDKLLQQLPTEATASMHFRQVALTGRGLLDLHDEDIAQVQSVHGEPSNYELCRLEHIAQTPSASVFTVKHSQLPDDIVAKVIRYEGKKTDLIRCAMNWEREKGFLEKLNHANIMSLKAVDGRLFAMYVERLPTSLKRETIGELGPADARNILCDMASALAYLESQDVVHNDIKPANIAYSTQRGAVLLDFGLAAQSDEPVSSGGTPWYVPPEYLDDDLRGAPGDLWALGLTMLYVLGKTMLPERCVPGWLIRDVRRKRIVRETMLAWVDQVDDIRDGLDRDDLVESLVCNMLQTRERRIRAAEIVAALEGN